MSQSLKAGPASVHNTSMVSLEYKMIALGSVRCIEMMVEPVFRTSLLRPRLGSQPQPLLI